MFQVTIRVLRKVRCGGGACEGGLDEGLFPSVDECAVGELCGRRVCRRVNRAVQSVTMSAKQACSIRGAKWRAWSRWARLWQGWWVWGSYAIHRDGWKVSGECKEVCRKPQENEKHMDTQQSWR